MAVYESYSHIDRELATLAEAGRKLRSRRNTLAFPCRLPNELLVMIFSWVVVASFPGTSFDFNAPPITRWYQITHVCQRWRNVALDCPTLWHQLDVTTPRWMEEALNRTRRSLLSLRAEVYATRPRTLMACKTVLASSSRIRELHVSGDFVSLQTIAASLAAGQADNLRSLIWDHAHWRASVDVFEISTLLLNSGAPCLERLEIRGCHISFAAPLFTRSPKIETLIISGLRYATPKPLMSEVLAALESMPSLQHLYLENLLPGPSTHTPKDSCPLPAHLALQTLYLAGTVPECSYFLRHVHIPSSVAASVTCPDLDRLEDVTEFIASFCQARGEASLGTTTQPVEPLRFWSFALDPPSFLLVGSSTDGFPSPGVSPAGKELKYQQSYGLGLTINRVHHLTDTWSVMQKLLHGLPIDALSAKWILASAFNRDALDKNCWMPAKHDRAEREVKDPRSGIKVRRDERTGNKSDERRE